MLHFRYFTPITRAGCRRSYPGCASADSAVGGRVRSTERPGPMNSIADAGNATLWSVLAGPLTDVTNLNRNPFGSTGAAESNRYQEGENAMLVRIGLVICAMAASVPVALAQPMEDQPDHHPPGGMIDHGQTGMMQGSSPMMAGSTSPMMQSMQSMQQSMLGVALTGNPDHDFAALMIPHHQGAIDMARADLRDGKDPEMRKLAERIIKSQEDEIKEMNGWLAKTSAK